MIAVLTAKAWNKTPYYYLFQATPLELAVDYEGAKLLSEHEKAQQEERDEKAV